MLIERKKAYPLPPLRELSLKSGTHHLEIRNALFTPYEQTIELKGQETMKVRH